MVAIGGRYELEQFLGEGGMGTVYRALDTQTGNQVALKLTKPEVLQRYPEQAERFRREAEALIALDHPNVVRILDALDDNGQYVIVMEYLPGGTLRDKLKEHKRLDIRYTLETALDLSDALTRTHRLKIIHRDVKPENVLFTAYDIPKLTDFGQAHISTMETLTQVGQVMGTLNYLAPEMFHREPADPRTDIWCFGMMLYEMLTGFRPFMGQNSAEVMKAILTQPVPDLLKLRPECPPRLVKLVNAMLAKKREERIFSVREIGVEVEAILMELET